MLPEPAFTCSAPPTSAPARHSPPRRGASLLEAVTCVTLAALGIALAVPALAGVRGPALVAQSLDNLRVLGEADAAYAADWNDRQWTGINDTIGAYGEDAQVGWFTYNQSQGGGSKLAHPPLTLGWTPIDGDGPVAFFAYRTTGGIANARLCEPIVFSGINFPVNGYFGSFRFVNDARFTPYVAGTFYDQRFYAPADSVVQPLIEPLLGSPYEFVDAGDSGLPYWSGYVRSAAAMFDPAVMAGRRMTEGGPVGGWVDPWTLDGGFRAPSRSQVRYPGLKTSILEHHWLQGRPKDPCNPAVVAGTYEGCEPYYFNHGVASAPATLFFDGSTRLLPNAEVMAADVAVQDASGGVEFDGLWSRETPFGQDGYFHSLSLDDPDVSHHVLTADGILGRDTLGSGQFDAPMGRGSQPAAQRLLDAAARLVPRRPAPLSARVFGPASAIDPGPHAR